MAEILIFGTSMLDVYKETFECLSNWWLVSNPGTLESIVMEHAFVHPPIC